MDGKLLNIVEGGFLSLDVLSFYSQSVCLSVRLSVCLSIGDMQMKKTTNDRISM